ncbi:MAG: 2-oxo acid dehydrogenase subunit E2 [Chthoniobacterales bacterium]|nr:2-oxo acid dehydrogenase subunit E2 [Chthoniobacterales bacterium]
MPDITMPKLSDTMNEGTLVKWLKKAGDKIEVGDILAEVETDKATMEMEAFDEGTLLEILVPEGGVVKVGERLATLSGEAASVQKPAPTPSTPVANKPVAAPPQKTASKPLAPVTPKPRATVRTGGAPVKASPLARKMAADRGVDLSGVAGTGPGGRIVAADVPEKGMAPAARATFQTTTPMAKIDVPSSEADKRIPLSGMRRTIAERLLASKTQIPHFYLSVEIDADPLVVLRKDLNAAAESSGSPKVTVNDFVLLATARAALQHQKINAAFAGDSVVEYATVNLSVAISVDDGLITPVIRNAQSLTLREISSAVKDLALRARAKKLKPEEYQGGTLTVSNLGAYGIESFYAIINPPQAAILAVGTIVKKPVVNARDQIVVGQRMTLALSGDHRVVDGAAGAAFLATLKKSLETPATLLL